MRKNFLTGRIVGNQSDGINQGQVQSLAPGTELHAHLESGNDWLV